MSIYYLIEYKWKIYAVSEDTKKKSKGCHHLIRARIDFFKYVLILALPAKKS